MKFTDKEGREITVTVIADPKEVFGNDASYDPGWVDDVLLFDGNGEIIDRMWMLLHDIQIKVGEPWWYVPISKQHPRKAVVAAAIPVGLTPDQSDDDWTSEDAEWWARLTHGVSRHGVGTKPRINLESIDDV